MAKWVPNRMIQTAFWSLLLIFMVGTFWPRAEKGIPPEVFWILKSEWFQNADVVCAGDSRIYRSLSPAKMSEWLSPLDIKNFGFSIAGFSRHYLWAIENVLKPDSPTPTIILGISPLSLTEGTYWSNGFLDTVEKSRWERFTTLYLGAFLNFVRPFEKWQFLNTLFFSHQVEEYSLHYYADGWVASSLNPPDPEQKMDHYRRLFYENPVSERVLKNLYLTLQKWTQKGIRVYGFRPPTTLKMEALENEISGFQEEVFIQKFQQSGGIWLDFGEEGWESYDGSHLQEKDALRLSEMLAERLFQDLKPK